MRGRAAPGSPAFRKRGCLLGGGARVEVQSDPHRLLHGKIAARPGVAVAETEQEIDVGGPGADAVQCRQRGMGEVGLLLAECVEVEPFGCKLARQRL